MSEIFTQNDSTVNRRKKSLLLYFETCLVDNEGFVNGLRINQEEVEWAKTWVDSGLITFGRVLFKEIIFNNTHEVRFSDEAWNLAHQFRRERAEVRDDTIE